MLIFMVLKIASSNKIEIYPSVHPNCFISSVQIASKTQWIVQGECVWDLYIRVKMIHINFMIFNNILT